MSGHTPGPWSVGPPHVIKAATDLSGGGRQTRWVAEAIYCVPIVDGEQDANARLIAAAPDMLEALWSALADPYFPELGTVTKDVVRAAIAKAGGKP